MRFAFVALAFLGAAGAAFADGPVKLTEAQMDAVTAGSEYVFDGRDITADVPVPSRSVGQVGNEIDEFVTNVLRRELLGFTGAALT